MAENGKMNAMAMNCPSCGGSMLFDPAKGKLVCEYCDSEYVPEEVDAYWKEKADKNTAVKSDGIEGMGDLDQDMQGYSCSSCGAELLASDITGVIRCPYCGNQTVAPAQFSGSIRPDSIIPFANTKDEAISKYHAYYNKRFLLPKSFKTDSHVSEIQGVYVPFWLFNGKASLKGSYLATDVVQSGDKFEEVNKYKVIREGSLECKNVPADASKRMDNDLMDSIEPYKLAGLKDFSLTYLPGFLAERFDVDEGDAAGRAEERVSNTIKNEVEKTIDHSRIEEKSEDVKFERAETGYALLPVWLLTTKYKNEKYQFAMNGQTGKMIGDLPISVPKFLMIIIPVFLVLLLLMGGMFGYQWEVIMIDIIITVVLGCIMYGSMKPVAKASSADDYISRQLELTVKEEEFIGKEKRKK